MIYLLNNIKFKYFYYYILKIKNIIFNKKNLNLLYYLSQEFTVLIYLIIFIYIYFI